MRNAEENEESASANDLRKFAAVIELDGAVGDWVILKPHEMEVEYWRELLKHDSLLSVLQPKGPCVVLVVTVQRLRLDVVGEAFFDGLLPLDVKLDVVEGLCPCRLVVHILAPDIRHLVLNGKNIAMKTLTKSFTILPSKRRGMVPSTQVAFILDSSLSSSTLRMIAIDIIPNTRTTHDLAENVQRED